MEAGLAIQIIPHHTKDNTELCRIVDQVIAYIQSEFPNACVCPFETVIEGDLDQCMRVATEAQRRAIKAGACGVSCNIKLSYNPSGVLSTEEKLSKYSGSSLS